MKRLFSSNEYKAKDVNVAEDGVFHVKSHMNSYEVNFGSEDTFPFCSCEDFRRTYLPCKHFFAVFKLADKSWNDLSPMYRQSPYLKLDESVFAGSKDPGCFPSASESVIDAEDTDVQSVIDAEDTDVQPESLTPQQSLVSMHTGDSNFVKALSFYQREFIAELKVLQNLTYNCTSIATLSAAKEKLQDIKGSLLNHVPREGGLPVADVGSPLLRKLPTRKKYPKRNRKFQKRVGRMARIMKKSICTGKICL